MKGGLLLLLLQQLQLHIIIIMALSLVLVRGNEDGGRKDGRRRRKTLSFDQDANEMGWNAS